MKKLIKYLFVICFIIWLVVPLSFGNNYELRFSTSCLEDSVNKAKLLETSSSYSVNLNDKYCPLCGKLMSEDVLILQNAHCSKCNKSISEDVDFCSKCGGDIKEKKYVPLKDVTVKHIRDFDSLKHISNVGSVCGWICIIIIIISFIYVCILVEFDLDTKGDSKDGNSKE